VIKVTDKYKEEFIKNYNKEKTILMWNKDNLRPEFKKLLQLIEKDVIPKCHCGNYPVTSDGCIVTHYGSPVCIDHSGVEVGADFAHYDDGFYFILDFSRK
jgi:hypothetical protein